MKNSIILIIVLTCSIVNAQNKQHLFSDFMNSTAIKKMDSLIQSNKLQKITSVVVSYKGNIILENYYNQSDKDTRHNTRSATKSITSALIGRLLQDQRLISVKEKASKFSKFKNIQNPDVRKNQITIEDLLTMSSILECDDWDQNSRGNEERMYLIEDWVKFYWDLPIKGFPEWVSKPKDTKYGRSYSYCTAGVVVLGDIIENITGSLKNYAEKEFFKKLGIKDYHWQITPTGLPMTGGGLGLRSRDFIKIGQLYLNEGIWNNEQILPKDFIKNSIKPHAEVGMLDYQYGYLWWLAKFGKENKEQAYFMSGSGGNKIAIFPSLDLVVVLTSTFFNGRMNSHHQTARLLDEFIVPEIQKLK
jgi:CubicO group peptidase (beta-lactamase class C family)